jgi:hypothetical protein
MKKSIATFYFCGSVLLLPLDAMEANIINKQPVAQKQKCHVECANIPAEKKIKSEIITTSEIDDIESEFKKIDDGEDANVLVAIDCDDTIIEHNSSILRAINEADLRKTIANKIKIVQNDRSRKLRSYDEIYRYYECIILRDEKYKLLNPHWPSLIENLQSGKTKVILLTACKPGEMEKYRYECLRSLGIDFKKSWPNIGKLTFDIDCTVNPVFKDGMLLTGDAGKGDTLKAFLSQFPDYKFKKIIFIDDKNDNIMSVKEAVFEYKAQFVGIEYTYAKTKVLTPLEIEKVKKQFKILIDEEHWVPDEELD